MFNDLIFKYRLFPSEVYEKKSYILIFQGNSANTSD